MNSKIHVPNRKRLGMGSTCLPVIDYWTSWGDCCGSLQRRLQGFRLGCLLLAAGCWAAAAAYCRTAGRGETERDAPFAGGALCCRTVVADYGVRSMPQLSQATMHQSSQRHRHPFGLTCRLSLMCFSLFGLPTLGLRGLQDCKFEFWFWPILRNGSNANCYSPTLHKSG
jgi:hypothetical protein